MKSKTFPRTGFGFDAHEFASNGTLVLGGVRFKGFPQLSSHSDGDAVIHAIIDALLGGAGAGDIGDHFPDSASKYRGINSAKLLAKTIKIIQAKGFSAYFVDVTIVAEKPRFSKIKGKITASLAKQLKLSPSSLNIKAKRPEGTQLLSPRGSIAVWAVATLLPR